MGTSTTYSSQGKVEPLQGKALIDATVDPQDPRIEAVTNVLVMLTDEGGRIFNPLRLYEISKTIVFWIDQVKR